MSDTVKRPAELPLPVLPKSQRGWTEFAGEPPPFNDKATREANLKKLLAAVEVYKQSLLEPWVVLSEEEHASIVTEVRRWQAAGAQKKDAIAQVAEQMNIPEPRVWSAIQRDDGRRLGRVRKEKQQKKEVWK